MLLFFFKKGDCLQCNNYRPISLTSNISKITDKLVHRRLYFFLEQNNILYNSQYHFGNKHSTNLDFAEKIRKALDRKHYACGVYIDLQKAFDTIILSYWTNFATMKEEVKQISGLKILSQKDTNIPVLKSLASKN